LSEGQPDAAPAPDTVVGQLDAIAEGEVTLHTIDERDSVLLVRRGAEVRAWRNICPHQWLPLTYRSPKILSADGLRLRCSNHFAEFSVDDGRPLGDAGLACGLEPVPVHVDCQGRLVLRPRV
jgi:nitrite reductase/ring-hydroxylating ferredoxin subunit